MQTQILSGLIQTLKQVLNPVVSLSRKRQDLEMITAFLQVLERIHGSLFPIAHGLI